MESSNFNDNLKYAKEILSNLKNTHKLSDVWSIKVSEVLDNGALSTCDITTFKIKILQKFLESKYCTFKFIETALYHEVAHILAGNCERHNDIWRAKCIALGGNGRIRDVLIFNDDPEFVVRLKKQLATIPQNQDITDEVEIELSKVVVDQMLAEGHDITNILQMYMEAFNMGSFQDN